MNVRTARKYAHAATAEALIGPNASSRPSVLAPFHPYLRQRLTDGVYQTAVLHAEIVAHGYHGSLRVLRGWLAINRIRPAPSTAVRVPSARRITAWSMRPGHKLTDDDRADLADARRRCPDLDTVAGLARGFAALVRHQGTGQHLDAWIDRARHAGYPELRGFAAGLAGDRDARRRRPRSALELRPGRGPGQPHQDDQATDVWPGEPRPPPQTRPDHPMSEQQDQSQNVCQNQISAGVDIVRCARRRRGGGRRWRRLRVRRRHRCRVHRG